MTPLAAHVVAVWQDRVHLRVLSRGQGPPLVFFHGPWGLEWDPFLDALARSFTVYAPEHPGTTPDRPEDAYALDGLWDLVLCYEEALTALGLRAVVLVGHSFGGMVACELAAAYPERVRRLVLIAPLGFWRDDAPVTNWMLLTPEVLRDRLFYDPEGEAARRLWTAPPDPEAAVLARVRATWAMGATGKFLWPLPDRGLARRIHRVRAPSLLVWGREDRIVPPAYAEEFARRLPGARVAVVERAGHLPHLEHPDEVARLVGDFAGAAGPGPTLAPGPR